MLPGGGAAPRGGGKRNAVYRSYYFLPQYFRRVVKVSAVAWPSTPFQPPRPYSHHAGTALRNHSYRTQSMGVAFSSGSLPR